MLPSRLKRWLQRAFALADGVETFAASTIAGKRRALERSLNDILATATGTFRSEDRAANSLVPLNPMRACPTGSSDSKP